MLLRTDETGPAIDRPPLLICDLTQSYSESAGGGVGTYLREKRDHVLHRTPHRLLQIVPGREDRTTVAGRHVFVEVASAPVRGSPDYRFILRTRRVREILAQYRPDIIESLCPWVLPWTAIRHARAFPGVALVAGYRTDFPNAHVHRVARDLFGEVAARGFRALAWGYAELTYRAFDHVYTLGEPARAALARRGITHTSVLSLGVDAATFATAARDPGFRASLGLAGSGPLLVYAGRIDNEKRADRLVAMMRALPGDLGAALVMIGDGKLRDGLAAEAAASGLPIAFPGFVRERAALARALASSDIYVSAMADETFGLSVLEAQAAGLPVVGVAGGAMPDRVPPGTGLLGPVDDVAALAANVVAIWHGDREAMRRNARTLAARNDWAGCFETLIDRIYPAAMARAGRRARSVSGTAPGVSDIGGRVRAGRRSGPTRVADDPPC